MLIFRKANDTEEDVPKHQHEFSGYLPLKPKKPMDEDFVQDYRKEHQESIKHNKINPYFSSSLFIQPNGKIDILNDRHDAHLFRTLKNIKSEKDDKTRRRYNDNFSALEPIYELAHNVFDGALRIWVPSSYRMVITGFQIPDDQQMMSIQKLLTDIPVQKIELELDIEFEGIRHRVYKVFENFQLLKEFIKSLKNQYGISEEESLTPEVMERIQKMRFFRNPLEEEKPQIPARKIFPGANLTQQQIENILKKRTTPTPSSLRYPGAESINSLIKIAQNFAQNKKENEANIIIRLIEKIVRD